MDPNGVGGGSNPKRKPQRRKAKNKLAETYPAYFQEAFFGRDLLQKAGVFFSDSLSDNDSSQTAKGSGSDSERIYQQIAADVYSICASRYIQG